MNRALVLIVSWLALAFQGAECIRYSEVFPHGEKAGDSLLPKGDNVNVTANLRWSYNIFGSERNKITVSWFFSSLASQLKSMLTSRKQYKTLWLPVHVVAQKVIERLPT